MIQCPECNHSIDESFGVIHCPNCEAVFIVNYSGEIERPTEERPLESSTLSHLEGSKELIPPPFQEGPVETSLEENSIEEKPTEEKPTEENSANFESETLLDTPEEFFQNHSSSLEELSHESTDLEQDSPQADPLGFQDPVLQDPEPPSPEIPVEGGVNPEDLHIQDSISQDPVPEGVHLTDGAMDQGALESVDGSALSSQKDTTPVNVTSFANSQDSLLVDGELVYDLEITEVDSPDLKENLKYVLMDDKLKLDASSLMKTMNQGRILIANLNPIKAKRIVEQLQFWDLEVRWSQKRVTMEMQGEELEGEPEEPGSGEFTPEEY